MVRPNEDCKTGQIVSLPELMTEKELIMFLRIPEVSSAKDHHNVIENLKRMRNLPRLHICNKTLYPLEVIREWIKDETKIEE
jgi:hypothetical protein